MVPLYKRNILRYNKTYYAFVLLYHKIYLMFKYSLIAVAIVCSAAALFSCHSSPQETPLTDSSAKLPEVTAANDVGYKDQQQIAHVILGFCENFDNGHLDKCVAFMDDSIRGE
jgi:hypothetical protein